MKFIIFSFIFTISALAVDKPTDKDALALKDAQLKVLQASAELDRILRDPTIIRAQAAIIEAQVALKVQQEKYPTCELKSGNIWVCASPTK